MNKPLYYYYLCIITTNNKVMAEWKCRTLKETDKYIKHYGDNCSVYGVLNKFRKE